ncbi:MAG TPA: type 4a pilus biogenesis protein PilO [Gaiellaceae bacterium]
MKKKLAALPMKVQVAGAGVGVLLVAVLGYMFVVSPQHAKAADLQKQIDAQQSAVYHRRAELKAGLHPPEIQTADLFRLARAMPDSQDMPGIILTLSQVARASGIRFDLIEPVVNTSVVPTPGYTDTRIHLLFNGDFYGLSDFLYRLRSLVAVRDGTLEATGRLFNVSQVTFNVQANQFPQISAELYVDAYVYTPTAPATSSTPSTTTTTTPTTTTPTDTTSSTDATTGATAVGPTP